MGAILLSASAARAGEYSFSPADLEGAPGQFQDVDLSLFSNQNAQLPGVYSTTIFLNNVRLETKEIAYISGPDGALQPALTPQMLREWGIGVDAVPALAGLAAQKPLAEPLGSYIPAASAGFNMSQLRLDISMPQAYITGRAQGAVDPSLWDDGVPVLFTNYNFSGSDTEDSSHTTRNSAWLDLHSGFNLGGWRVRNSSSWDKSEDKQHWTTQQTFLQHDINRLKAQFTAGESHTGAEVFDSIAYRGVNLASDEAMQPQSQRGFAPVIRGVASSNAEVSVRQNGNLIYRTNVAPGAFALDDIYATANSGDLEVTVKEADGSEHQFIQPWASVPVMQRPGRFKYDLTAGRYHEDGAGSRTQTPLFVEASGLYGLNNALTVYGGLLTSDHYRALATGLGFGLGEFGSIAADVTQARGRALRLMYVKNIAATDTQLTLSEFRYSRKGYDSFTDAMQIGDDEDEDRKRRRLQISLSQPLLGSSLYLNGYEQRYWNTRRKERSYSAGISRVINGINVHLAGTWSQTPEGDDDKMITLGINVPLSRWLPHSWAGYSYSDSQQGRAVQSLTLNGTALDDQRLSYALQQSRTEGESSASHSLYGSYRSQYANLNAGYYSGSDHSRQLSYGVSGALVAHPEGVTLSQPVGDAFAIVDANGASGVRFQNEQGIETDSAGFAIIPSLSVYQKNRIGMDTTTLPQDVDSNDTAVTVIPTRNAAVLAHFDARSGYRVLATLTRENQQPVPFGAVVSIEKPAQSGIVDDNGTVYLSGLRDDTRVQVKWGSAPDQSCTAHLSRSAIDTPAANPAGLRFIHVTCLTEPDHATPSR